MAIRILPNFRFRSVTLFCLICKYFLYYMYDVAFFFQASKAVLCEPRGDGVGGIPAGCQCDKEGNIYVADMRLGILKVSQKGEFQQVKANLNEHPHPSLKG